MNPFIKPPPLKAIENWVSQKLGLSPDEVAEMAKTVRLEVAERATQSWPTDEAVSQALSEIESHL